ncbi:MAG: TIGR02757 family protein [Thermodesulfovibrionales bacterium]
MLLIFVNCSKIAMTKMHNLKDTLDKLYNEFDFAGRIISDPIAFPKRYNDVRDIEVSAFISSCFAYGQVDVFKSVIQRVLGICGKSPYDFILNFDVDRHSRLFSGIKYRFNETQDIVCLFHCLAEIIRSYKSLKSLFLSNFDRQKPCILPSIESFIEKFFLVDSTKVYGRNIKPFGFKQFLPSPRDKSPCKRFNLFMRWMVRDRDIDFGIWGEIPKDMLIIPLDTHIARIARCLGLTNRSSVDIKMAIEITENLKTFDPQDPLKYDFALCHIGMSGVCNKKNCLYCRIKNSG